MAKGVEEQVTHRPAIWVLSKHLHPFVHPLVKKWAATAEMGCEPRLPRIEGRLITPADELF